MGPSNMGPSSMGTMGSRAGEPMNGNVRVAYQPTIRDLPQGERPRERLKEYGAKHLSNAELIAILLRTGMQGENVLSLSSKVLAQFSGLAGLELGCRFV